jgi:hypothetical protein
MRSTPSEAGSTSANPGDRLGIISEKLLSVIDAYFYNPEDKLQLLKKQFAASLLLSDSAGYVATKAAAGTVPVLETGPFRRASHRPFTLVSHRTLARDGPTRQFNRTALFAIGHTR